MTAAGQGGPAHGPGTTHGPGTPHGPGTTHGPEHFAGLPGLVIGLSMLVRRGATSRLVAELAGLVPGDRVLDVGCGPGSAAREAARAGAVVTGVDPAPLMLRLGRALSSRAGRDISFLAGTAEALPVPDGSASIAWAISSVHHWADAGDGLRELHRVLAPGGRFVVAERLSRPGARGMAAHGFTQGQADGFAAAARAAGFADVRTQIHRAGRRTLVTVTGSR